jgi:Protein of unknown function (DUF1573)
MYVEAKNCGKYFSKEMVWAGKEGIIKVLYKRNGQAGAIRKTIDVSTNASNGAWRTHALYGEVNANSAKKQ